MKKITLLAIEGCLSSSISNLLDAFTIANLWHRSYSGKGQDLFEIEVVTPDGKPISCNSCVQVHAHLSFESTANTDYLIIPALVPIPDSTELQKPEILEFIRKQYFQGSTISSVCTGAFLLAETGLLDGKRATTNWQFARKFQYRYPQVKLHIDKVLTEQDRLICSGAVTAIMHLALKIIKREGSTRLASTCAKAMLVDPNNDSQTPYTNYPIEKRHKDANILKAEQYMRKHLSETMSIDQVAEAVCISSRHFKRRFKAATGDSPLTYLQKLRIQTAKDQLENSLDSIDEITRCIGYEDGSTFRRLFKRHTSLSPREYRDRFLQVKSS